MMHWVHRDSKGPEADAYRAAIKAHYDRRTAGYPTIPDGEGGRCRFDKWWDLYAGREYQWENKNGAGLEVPTKYFELFADPAQFLRQMDPIVNVHASSFLETLKLTMGIFYT